MWKRISVLALLVFLGGLIRAGWAADNVNPKDAAKAKPAAAVDSHKTVKPTQTAPSAQSRPQTADDDVPVMIEVKPESKNTITLGTSPGMQEGSARRHETYNRITGKAKHDALEARRAAEQSEAQQNDAEASAKDKEGETDKKPPAE